jgi:Zn-dependent protease with chaperone function
MFGRDVEEKAGTATEHLVWNLLSTHPPIEERIRRLREQRV